MGNLATNANATVATGTSPSTVVNARLPAVRARPVVPARRATLNTRKKNRDTAVLGGGCFWCLEAVFDDLAGVESVESGYAGGANANPTYDDVCSGQTGHAEVVRVTFDPSVLSYRDLLSVFFAIHDPTTKD